MKRRTLVRGVGLLLMPTLSGCGFRPLYADARGGAPGPAQEGLAAITVPVLPERNGQLLRQALQERFERAGVSTQRLYDLVVGYSVSGDPIAYQQDNSVTRIREVGIAKWSLLAQDVYRSTLTSGTARNVDGFNILDQQYFASDLESEAVQRRIAGAVADQITQQLASYFVKRAATG